jgi:AP2 domain
MNKTSLPKGVRRSQGKYQAKIKIGQHYQHIGTYATAEEAAMAYCLAERLAGGVTLEEYRSLRENTRPRAVAARITRRHERSSSGRIAAGMS